MDSIPIPTIDYISQGDYVNMCITIASISIAILTFLLQRRLDTEKENIDNVSIIPFQNLQLLNFQSTETFLLVLRQVYGSLPQFIENRRRYQRLSSILHSTLIVTSFALFVVIISIFNTSESLKIFNVALFIFLIVLLGSLIGGFMIWAREEIRFNGL